MRACATADRDRIEAAEEEAKRGIGGGRGE